MSHIDSLGRKLTIDEGHLQADVKGYPFVDRTDDEQVACDDCHRLLQQRSLGALVEH